MPCPDWSQLCVLLPTVSTVFDLFGLFEISVCSLTQIPSVPHFHLQDLIFTLFSEGLWTYLLLKLNYSIISIIALAWEFGCNIYCIKVKSWCYFFKVGERLKDIKRKSQRNLLNTLSHSFPSHTAPPQLNWVISSTPRSWMIIKHCYANIIL